MDLIVNNSREQLEKSASEKVSQAVRRIAAKKNIVLLAVCGGRSVPGIFNQLLKQDIPWEKVHIFMADERFVPIDNPESNFFIVKKHLIDYLIQRGCLKDDNIHPFQIDKNAKDYGLRTYEEKLKEYGEAYDVVLLSSGEDGHIASLFPDHHSVWNDSKFFLQIHDSPKPPPLRMSMSKNMLANTDTAVLLFFGSSKREALAKFLDAKVNSLECPAKLVINMPHSFVFSDQKL